MSAFINYTSCVQIKRLFLLMGIKTIPALPKVNWEEVAREIYKEFIPDPSEIKITKKLKRGIEVLPSELGNDRRGLLKYKGRKVVAYIMDQYYRAVQGKHSEYKFHLCNCATLQQMKAEGRYKRYVVTQRDDGWFEIRTGGRRSSKRKVKMELCKNCERVLQRHGIRFTSLGEYFKKYDSYVPPNIRDAKAVEAIQKYSPSHKEIANKYKEVAKFRCLYCGVDCSRHKHLLHLHHINGVKGDNSHENLMVLCADCHAHQPRHEQMRSSFKQAIIEVKQLRKKQGIPQV